MASRDDRPGIDALLALLPADFALVLPDGRRLGPERAAARATLLFRDPDALAAVAATPSLQVLGEAFIGGGLDVEGDLVGALEAAYAIDGLAAPFPSVPVLRPPDHEAIRHHYDLPAEFFALFLDRRMVYTCAYYRRPEATLDEAQEEKLDLVCRKLALARGEAFLDVGCGWGALTAWAAERYGVDAVGVTLSAPQAEWAQRMLLAGGSGTQARFEHRHYRDVAGHGVFHKIAAIGIIEHVGIANYPEYFARLHGLLRRGGLLLNQGITHATPGRHSTGMAFLTRHVFPGAEFQRIGYVVEQMEEAGLRVLDVESLGGHYARTTAAWLARLRCQMDRARQIVGERASRTWLAYLAAATVAFRAGWIDLHQVLAVHPDAAAWRMPHTREHWYAAVDIPKRLPAS